MELNQSKKDMDWLTSVKFYNFFFNKYVQLIAEKKNRKLCRQTVFTRFDNFFWNIIKRDNFAHLQQNKAIICHLYL